MPCNCGLPGRCGQICRKPSGQGDLLESPGLLTPIPWKISSSKRSTALPENSTGGLECSFQRPPDQLPASEILSLRLASVTACRHPTKRSVGITEPAGIEDLD